MGRALWGGFLPYPNHLGPSKACYTLQRCVCRCAYDVFPLPLSVICSGNTKLVYSPFGRVRRRSERTSKRPANSRNAPCAFKYLVASRELHPSEGITMGGTMPAVSTAFWLYLASKSMRGRPNRALPNVRPRPTTALRVARSRRRQRLRSGETDQDTHSGVTIGHRPAHYPAPAASDGPEQPFLSAPSAAPKPRHVADAARDAANCGQAERLRSAHAAEEPAGQQRLTQVRWRARSDVPANGCGMSIMLHRHSQRA